MKWSRLFRFVSFHLIDLHNDDSLSTGDKYEAVSMESGYNKYMMLKIRYVRPQDFGSYRCVAKNSLGETDGVIKLEGEAEKCFSYVTHSRFALDFLL